MKPTPQDALRPYPLRHCALTQGTVAYRRAGKAQAPTHVLLHGISSSSSNWAYQLQAVADRPDLQVLAWDAPGYGASSPLDPACPLARDYATRLWAWLDAMNATAPLVLVGHSLGALMAASAAVLRPARIASLVLLAPAQGYGAAPEAERNRKRDDRLAILARLGPAGMAATRTSAMLAPDADAGVVEAVKQNMANIHVAGYTQATQMLAQGTLLHDLEAIKCPVVVASGDVDTITTPPQCELVARQARTTRISLGPVGHICTLEAASTVNQLLKFESIR